MRRDSDMREKLLMYSHTKELSEMIVPATLIASGKVKIENIKVNPQVLI